MAGDLRPLIPPAVRPARVYVNQETEPQRLLSRFKCRMSWTPQNFPMMQRPPTECCDRAASKTLVSWKCRRPQRPPIWRCLWEPGAAHEEPGRELPTRCRHPGALGRGDRHRKYRERPDLYRRRVRSALAGPGRRDPRWCWRDPPGPAVLPGTPPTPARAHSPSTNSRPSILGFLRRSKQTAGRWLSDADAILSRLGGRWSARCFNDTDECAGNARDAPPGAPEATLQMRMAREFWKNARIIVTKKLRADWRRARLLE